MPLELDASEKATLNVQLNGVDVGTAFHFDFTPPGVATYNAGYIEAGGDGETVLRVWPFGFARDDIRAAEDTITVTGNSDDPMVIIFGAPEPK